MRKMGLNDWKEMEKGIIEVREADRKILYDIERKTSYLAQRYGIAKKEIIRIAEANREVIPLSTLCTGMAPLQSVVLNLKENQGLSIKAISKMLRRSYKTIWTTYNKARGKKCTSKKSSEESKTIFIPIKAISSDKLGILESAVLFLKEKHNMRYSEIATLLGRNPRTIWTAYHKAKEKEREK